MPGIVSTFPVVVEHIEEFWGIITEELKKRWDPRPMIYKTKMNAYGGGGGGVRSYFRTSKNMNQ